MILPFKKNLFPLTFSAGRGAKVLRKIKKNHFVREKMGWGVAVAGPHVPPKVQVRVYGTLDLRSLPTLDLED